MNVVDLSQALGQAGPSVSLRAHVHAVPDAEARTLATMNARWTRAALRAAAEPAARGTRTTTAPVPRGRDGSRRVCGTVHLAICRGGDSAVPGEPAAFMSYARFNDEHDDGQLTMFRQRLAAEVRAQSRQDFAIFQDRADIGLGPEPAPAHRGSPRHRHAAGGDHHPRVLR
jgi:hypothetical protein